MFTTLNIYSHITDTMRKQAAARIDREIAGADTPIPESEDEDKEGSTSRPISRQRRNLSLIRASTASPARVV